MCSIDRTVYDKTIATGEESKQKKGDVNPTPVLLFGKRLAEVNPEAKDAGGAQSSTFFFRSPYVFLSKAMTDLLISCRQGLYNIDCIFASPG